MNGIWKVVCALAGMSPTISERSPNDRRVGNPPLITMSRASRRQQNGLSMFNEQRPLFNEQRPLDVHANRDTVESMESSASQPEAPRSFSKVLEVASEQQRRNAAAHRQQRSTQGCALRFVSSRGRPPHCYRLHDTTAAWAKSNANRSVHGAV